MKKGWQKRLQKSAFKGGVDLWNIDYGEFLLQLTIWGVVVLGAMALNRKIILSETFKFQEYFLPFVAVLFGASIVYYFKNKKKK
jgi:hypothetical protein